MLALMEMVVNGVSPSSSPSSLTMALARAGATRAVR